MFLLNSNLCPHATLHLVVKLALSTRDVVCVELELGTIPKEIWVLGNGTAFACSCDPDGMQIVSHWAAIPNSGTTPIFK